MRETLKKWYVLGLVMMMIMVVNLIVGRANPAGRMETVNANPKGTLSWQQSSKAEDRKPQLSPRQIFVLIFFTSVAEYGPYLKL